MQWTAAINDDRRASSGIVARTPRAHDAAPIRFMIAIDNFEHIVQAYGEPLADRAVGRVRQAIGEWLGEQAELHFESAGIFYGTLHPLEPAPHAARRSDAGSRINRILINPPVVTLPLGAPISGAPDGGDIYLSISGTWAVQDHTRRCEPAAFEGGCRAPFFGQLAGRGESWAARYRADMSVASAVLGTIRQPSARIALPLAARSMSGAVYRATAADAAGLRSEPEQAVAGHLACAWRPVRDARYGQDVLFYEMCPQVVGRDGARRDLADARIALERLGLAATLDRHLVDHALDLLETDPDVALGVQISAQSVSACARWGDVFRRLTGSRTVARRLTIAITETACFPDFAEAVQFVSRLQAFGCAVGIDNFGLGYPVVFALFSLIFFARIGGREILIPLALVATVVFIDVFCVASALAAGPDNFVEIDRNLVFYTSPVAVANSLVFKPKLALSLNLLIIASIGSAALIALLDSASGAGVDLHLLARVVGVVGFYLWFAVAQYIALTLYVRHRRELVEIHHLVAEMERNQRLNEENSRIREDLVRTQRVQMVDSMTSTMAHEVNQPISCANNYIAAARRWLMRSEPDVGEAMISLDGAQGEIVRVSERVMSVRRLMQRLSSKAAFIRSTSEIAAANILSF